MARFTTGFTNAFNLCLILCIIAMGCSRGEEIDEIHGKPVAVDSKECVGKEDGIYPNPSNCSTFIACSGNVTHVIQCNEGLLFDESSSRCEWASSAKCTLRPEPANKEPDTTEETLSETSTTEASLPVSMLPAANEEESLPVEMETVAPPTATVTSPENNGTEHTTMAPVPAGTPPPENRLVFKNITELNPYTDNPVEGGLNAQNETLYVCRARYAPGVIVPGQTDLKNLICYVPGDDGSFAESFDDFEVLTNPMRQPLAWLLVGSPTAKVLPENTVVGGKFLASSLYAFYVGRCGVKPTEEAPEQLIPGSVHFSGFSFVYEAKVATQLKTFRCKENFSVLVYA